MLTIKVAKLADLGDDSPFTYKCSVTSSQYPASLASGDVEVVATVLTIGRFT